MHRPLAITLTLATLLGACTTAATRSGPGRPLSRPTDRVISAEQLASYPPTLTLHDVVVLDRVGMLRGRYAGALVYVDGLAYGDHSALRAIPISNVREVRLLTTTEAAAKYGTMKGVGSVIDVLTVAVGR